MPSSNTRVCPVCATVMPAGFPAGLCPKCLLTASVEPALAADEARPGGVPSLGMLRRLFQELEILELLGAGGMGAVYKARQPRLNRLVALKIMVCPPGHEADFALRFEREAQVLARLNHPHIVILYDFGELSPERTGADPIFYFLMEFVDGTDLGQLIKARELTSSQALAIVPQICEALQYAHDQGVTHRDIKPANILLDKKGVVKIADFGLAKMIGSGTEETLMGGLTQTGTAMGTPHYMAPEQWEHPQQVDHRADIYALGVVFYEMLTGERPAGVFEPPSRKTSPPVDRKLDKVVLRAMEKDPERRYQQAGQIQDDVTRISGAHKRRPAATGAEEPKRGPLKPLLALGAAAALAAGGWMLWQSETAEPTAAAQTAKAVPAGSSASPQAPAASPAAFPAGQWTKVLATQAEVDAQAGLKGRVTLKSDGWLDFSAPKETSGVGLTAFSAANAGVRVKLRIADRTPLSLAISLTLRHTTSPPPRQEGYRLQIAGGDTSNPSVSLALYDGQTRKTVQLDKDLLPGALKAGDEMILEFYTIGSRLIGRVNGVLLSVEDTRLTRGIFTLQSGHLLRDIELINLDGLSEAEALKLAGVEIAASAVPPPVPGQWSHLDLPLAEQGEAKTTSDGWLLLAKRGPNGGQITLSGCAARNAGLRGRFHGADFRDMNAPHLTLRASIENGRRNGIQLHLDEENKTPTVWIKRFSKEHPNGADLLKRTLAAPLPPDREYTMELYIIGSQVSARCNQELFQVALDRESADPGQAAFIEHLGPDRFRDLHFINLDGLPEAEALKLAGLGGDEARESGRGDDPAGAPWENLLDDPELKSSLRPAAAGYEARHWATVERGPGRDGAIRCRLLYDGKPNYFRLVALKQDKGWYQAYLMPWGGMIQYVDSELPVGKFKDLPEVETSRLPAALEPGQEVELELRVRGESLEFRVNGQVVCTGSDMHLGPGRWGFCNNSETPVTIRSLDFQNASSLEPGAGGLPATGLTLRALIHGGSRYTLIREKLPWPDARRRAEALGRSLAVFESEEEERAVRDHFRDSLGTGCWIGGHAEEGSPDIRWLSGTPVGTVTWAVGHPYWRADKNSAGARTEGTFWPAGLVLTGQSVLIQPQKGARIGFICEQPADAAGRSRDTPGLPGRLRAAGTTANGKPHDLAKFAAHDDFVDVAGGWGRWVALRANGQTVSSDGRADFTGITKIAASFNAEYAFITQAGKLVIPDDETWALPAELEQGVVDAALGMQHGIALLEGGRAVVFGARYEGVVGDPVNPRHYGTPRWPPPEARALEQVKAVAATVTHAATLHEDGSLSLWGWEGPLEWRADPRQKPLRQLRSTEDGFWALDEAGQLWHQPVPRNPAPGQPVHVPGKPSLVESGVTHLRAPCWRRRSGEWSAHISTKEGMALMKDAGITEHTAFSLNGGLFAGKPFASLLWIEPEATDSGR